MYAFPLGNQKATVILIRPEVVPVTSGVLAFSRVPVS
jgi:hypothetical protein